MSYKMVVYATCQNESQTAKTAYFCKCMRTEWRCTFILVRNLANAGWCNSAEYYTWQSGFGAGFKLGCFKRCSRMRPTTIVGAKAGKLGVRGQGWQINQPTT